MKKQTQRVAYTAVLCALSILLLYLASVLPTARLAMIAISGILPAILVIRFGRSSGFLLYAAASILSLLLLPGKLTAVLYVVLFGHYPVMKSLIERIHKLWLEWLLKLSLFNVLLTLLLVLNAQFIGVDLFSQPFSFPLPLPVLYLAVYFLGNLAFVIYDLGFSRLVALYLHRFGSR